MTTTHDLTGHTVVVTGAAGDIGAACALRLASGGATVALCDLPGRTTSSGPRTAVAQPAPTRS